MSLSITSTQFDWNDRRTANLELWITANLPWIDGSSVLHGAGDVEDGVFVQRVASVSNNTTTHKLTIPAFTLIPTLDAIRGTTTRLFFTIVQVNGQTVTEIKLVPLTENGLTVPATLFSSAGGDPSLADLIVYNTPGNAPERDTYLSDITRLIDANIGIDSPITTQDDLIIGNSDGNPARFPIGDNDGQILGRFNGRLRYVDAQVVYVESYYGVGISVAAAFDLAVAALGRNGGIVQLPDEMDVDALLTVGNGSGSFATGSATYSTKNGIILRGGGGGSEDNTSRGYSLIRYTGTSAPSGALLTAAGPMFKFGLLDVQLDCNNLVGIGLDLKHVQESQIVGIEIDSFTSIGFRHRAYSNPTGGGNGSNNNWIENVFCTSTNNGVTCYDLGNDTTASVGILDVAQNTYVNLRGRTGAATSTVGMKLRYIDACVFIDPIIQAVVGLQVVPPNGTSGASYPSTCTFINPSFEGGCEVAGSVAWAGADGLTLLNYLRGDGQPLPPIAPVGLFRGFDSRGHWFGQWNNQALLYASRSSSTAISNTASETAFDISYTLPANMLSFLGACLEIRAAGHHSTTGTPTVTMRFKIGSDVIHSAILQCGTVSNFGWSARSNLIARFIGAGGIMQRDLSYFGLAGGGTTPSADWGNFTLNTTVAKALTVTVQFSAADPANSITMDTFSAWLHLPGLTD
jgi:hypothetical protein